MLWGQLVPLSITIDSFAANTPTKMVSVTLPHYVLLGFERHLGKDFYSAYHRTMVTRLGERFVEKFSEIEAIRSKVRFLNCSIKKEGAPTWNVMGSATQIRRTVAHNRV